MWLYNRIREITGFCREDEICALLKYFAPYSGNSLPTFRYNLLVPSSEVLTLDDGTDTLHRNVGKELPLHAA
jgi:hypothetical protein